MERYFDVILDFLVSPKTAIEELKWGMKGGYEGYKSGYLTFSLIVFLTAILTQSIAAHLLLAVKSQQSVVMFILGLLLILLTLILFGSLYIAWIHFIASFFSPPATNHFHRDPSSVVSEQRPNITVYGVNIKTAISAFAFCFIPLFVSSPLTVIFTTWTHQPVVWYILVMLFALLWIFSLLFITIKNLYSLTVFKSIVVFLSPIIPFVVLFIIIMFLITAGIYRLAFVIV
ncbi:MAG: hypothetical protein QME68_05600 [Elusimicrobiota bacterium]|nr:hypothetical protein [Elusimicrobiota bacterium]